MKTLTRFATPLIAVAMMTAPMMMTAQSSQMGQTQNSNTTDWSAPPAGTEQAQAYRDGIEAAKLDTVANRKVDAKASYLYNHPPVKKAAADSYRASFTAGYQAAVQHQTKGSGGE
jgi:hypothetical protein